MIVTAHTPGYLPGVSVIAKIARADSVAWLDEAPMTMPGYVNRNQLPDGTWLTVPVDRHDHRTPIHEVTIGGSAWRDRHLDAILDLYEDAPHFDPRIRTILEGTWANAGEPLADLNLRLVELIFTGLGLAPTMCRQSSVDSPRGGSLSTRIAKMVAAVGGTTYLAGPTPRLDPDVFAAEGIVVSHFTFAGENPSIIDPLFRLGELPTRPVQVVAGGTR